MTRKLADLPDPEFEDVVDLIGLGYDAPQIAFMRGFEDDDVQGTIDAMRADGSLSVIMEEAANGL